MSTSAAVKKPVGQHIDEAAWLAERRTGIGGSDVAAIFGLHKFKTAREVWLEKTGRAIEKEPTPDMLRGRALEDVAVKLFEQKTGLKTRRQPMRRFAPMPLLMASIDRQVIAGRDVNGTMHETGALEVKCPRSRTFWNYKRAGLPDYIILQMQVEAMVWQYAQTTAAIFGADDFQLLSFDVPFSPDVSKQVIEVVAEWWHTHIELGKEPSEDAATPELKDLPEVAGEIRMRTDEQFNVVVHDYMEAQALEKEAAAIKEQARTCIVQLVGEKGVYQGDAGRVYYTEEKGRAQHAETLKAVRAMRPLDPMLTGAKLLELGINTAIIEEIAEAARLDIDKLAKVGKPFETVRVFPVRALEE